MEREKGVTTAPCFRCGKAVPTVELPDGAHAAGPCPCSAEVVEVAATGQAEVRERGVVKDEDKREGERR